MDGILMNENELKQTAGKQKIPLGTIEKDYALTIILSRLGEQDFSKELGFKGGTAIKKAYFPEARFSEDLDFTCIKKSAPKKLEEFLKKEISNKKIECIQFKETTMASENKNSSKIKLGYLDIAQHPQSINFDLSQREKILFPCQEKQITNPYDQPKTKILTMNLTEIMAEKTRALITRSQPRDLYDIWFLSKKGTKINYSLIEQKLVYYNEKFSFEKIEQKIKEIEQKWTRDLDRLIRPIPEYKKIAAETIKIFSKQKP